MSSLHISLSMRITQYARRIRRDAASDVMHERVHVSQAQDGDPHVKHVVQLPMRVSHHMHTCAILFGINLHSISEVNECTAVRRSQASMLWGAL